VGTTSNAANTFLVGEAFANANHWTPLQGSWSLTGADYRGVHNGGGYRKSSLSDYVVPANFRLLTRLKSSVDNSLANVVFRAGDGTNDGNNRVWVRLDQRPPAPSYHDGGFHCFEDVGGAESVRGYYDFSPTVNQCYGVEVRASGASVKGYLDGVQRWTATVSKTSAGYLLCQCEYLSGHDAYFDYVCIGKYVEPDVWHGAWGAQEVMGDGYDTGTGAASVIYATQWLFTNQSDLYINQQTCNLVYDAFDSTSAYGQLENFYASMSDALVLNRVFDTQYNHNFAAVFYIGHMGMETHTFAGQNYTRYAFHAQAPWYELYDPDDPNDPNDPVFTATEPAKIWDQDVYPYTENSKQKFVFLWVCNNGNEPGNSTPIAHGAPYCWTRQILSPDGYDGSDGSGFCFMSFERASPRLSEGINHTSYIYGQWLVLFYENVLQGYTINQALQRVSETLGFSGWIDPQNELRWGYSTYWPGGGGIGEGWIPNNKMRIYGDGTITLPQ
jgi:hypothetical protein